MGIVDNVLAGSSGSSGYLIQRSLRFRSSASAYLNRTFSTPTSNQKGTWSGWVKRGTLGVSQFIFSAANYEYVRFLANDKIEISQPSATPLWTTTQVFRDPSAWYHIVVAWDTTQATAADRCKLWVNGSQITAWDSAAAITQNTAFSRWNINTYTGDIGDFQYNHTGFFDGYMADVYWVDGQQLTPSSFGYTNSYGVWQPTRYTGTYGTNGFYLPFTDNTSATTLAYDKSGNGNNWTPNNISTTAGVTYDSMTDVPTLTSATAANYAVLNPIAGVTSGRTVSDGNLQVATSSSKATIPASIAVSSGKWYWEVTCGATNNLSVYEFGIVSTSVNITESLDSMTGGSYCYYGYNGYKYSSTSGSSYGATFTNGDVIGHALDLDAGTLTFYKNNVSQGVAFTGISGTFYPAACSGSTGSNINFTANFGQRPFSYTPPTGFKALNTFNLPDPVIKKPNQYMDATLWTGNGTSQSIVNSGGFQPDLVWTKSRSNAYNNYLEDTVRGAGKTIASNTVSAEFTAAQLVTAFNSNGFTVGTDAEINGSTLTYVGWQWKESATAGFDIVTYTGNGANRNISHSLGIAPSMIIVKQRSSTEPWVVYNSNFSSPTGDYLFLNTTAAKGNVAGYWYTGANSSTFGVGPYSTMNANAATYVAYLFAEIAGFSKFGSYTGNGSADGPFVYCGFRPKYVLIKSSSVATTDWYVQDATVNPSNVVTNYLYPNLSSAEQTNGLIDFTSNGFKIRNNYAPQNQNGATFIFAAFAQNPLKYSLAR